MEEQVMVVEEVVKASGKAKKWILIGGAVAILGIATVVLVKKLRKGKDVTLLTNGDDQADQTEESN